METLASTPDVNESWPLPLQSASANELAELERQLITASPATFALGTSEGRWKMSRHLAYLDQSLLDSLSDAEAGQLGKAACGECRLRRGAELAADGNADGNRQHIFRRAADFHPNQVARPVKPEMRRGQSCAQRFGQFDPVRVSA